MKWWEYILAGLFIGVGAGFWIFLIFVFLGKI